MTQTSPSSLDRHATPGEARKARAIIRAMLNAGFTVSVHDGEEWTVKQSRDHATICDALATTDCDGLRMRQNGEYVGFVQLVYGNAHDGSELAGDWSAEGPVAAIMETLSR